MSAASYYLENQPALLRLIATGDDDSELLRELAARRKSDLALRLAPQGERKLFLATQTMREDFDRASQSEPGLRDLLSISDESFQSFRGKRVPMIRIPSFFNRPLPLAAADLILSLPFLKAMRSEIETLFARSVFSPGNHFFRTFTTDEGPAIQGCNQPTFASLLGLSHELGHCLFESTRGLTCAVSSEAQAQALEEVIVTEILQKDIPSLHEWARYQRSVDALAFYFYDEELALFDPNQPPHGGADRPFESTTFTLRDSLFINPGHQAIYCRASLTRLERLLAYPRSPWLLQLSDWREHYEPFLR